MLAISDSWDNSNTWLHISGVVLTPKLPTLCEIGMNWCWTHVFHFGARSLYLNRVTRLEPAHVAIRAILHVSALHFTAPTSTINSYSDFVTQLMQSGLPKIVRHEPWFYPSLLGLERIECHQGDKQFFQVIFLCWKEWTQWIVLLSCYSKFLPKGSFIDLWRSKLKLWHFRYLWHA